VLPVHDVGLTVRGEVPHTSSSLHYIAEMGNGRSWIQEDESSEGNGEQEVEHDSNDAKALNLGLSFHPERLRGFELGASYYRDSIRDVSDASIAHRVLATYLVYRTPSTEVMLEWLRLTHRQPGASEHVNHAGYVQFARAVGPAKPYYRYDRLSVNPSTPFIGAFESFAGHVAGVRFDPAQWVGLKAQYERTNQGSVRGIDAIRTQLVFVF
jgi:hypothetical protein